MKNILYYSLVCLFFLFGCAQATGTQKGALTGAVVGGGIGAIVGHQSAHTGEGAAIGAGAGAIAGALIGNKMDKRTCSVCGRKFSKSVEYCPYDGSDLGSSQ